MRTTYWMFSAWAPSESAWLAEDVSLIELAMADIQVILTALLSSDNDTRNQAEVRPRAHEHSMTMYYTKCRARTNLSAFGVVFSQCCRKIIDTVFYIRNNLTLWNLQ